MTEIIGFFIVVLVMVVVIIRRQILKGKLSQADFDDSADRLQLRLEDAADHIIERMEDHMNQLELLLGEADEKIVLLDNRIEELKNLSEQNKVSASDNRGGSSNEGNRKLAEPVRTKESLLIDINENSGNEVRRKKKIAVKPSKINQSVLEMLKNGYTIEEIAKKTGIGKGAILLIQEMYGPVQN